jgi:DNA-binding response OmpR family regulator
VAKIKIIDDEVDIAQVTAAILESAGHATSILTTTENAIQELIDDMPDIVILDVMFPENPAGGFDLARKIRKEAQTRDLPVILLTGINQEFPMGFSGEDIDPDWMPVQDFVEKPIDPDVLLGKIEEILRPEA